MNNQELLVVSRLEGDSALSSTVCPPARQGATTKNHGQGGNLRRGESFCNSYRA